MVDGKVVGFVAPDMMRDLADKLRVIKIDTKDTRVPTLTEIALVPEREIPGKWFLCLVLA